MRQCISNLSLWLFIFSNISRFPTKLNVDVNRLSLFQTCIEFDIIINRGLGGDSLNIEIIGTLASVLILVSFLFNEEKQIRMTNIIGAGIFVVYGLFTGAFSIWFLNASLIIIHLYKLNRMKMKLNR